MAKVEYLITWTDSKGKTHSLKEPALKWIYEKVSEVVQSGGIVTRIEKVL